jgi:hypothetical protein
LTRRQRFGCAALLSAALHGLVISSTQIALPDTPDEPRPLVARLASPPEPKAAPPHPPAKPPVRPARRRAPAPAPAPAPVPEVPAVTAESPIAVPEPAPDPAPVVESPPDTVAPEPPQQLALAAESSEAVQRTLPRRGRITYSAFYGDGGMPVGRVIQTWEASPEEYRITSEAETAGLVELFRPQRLRYLSEGAITRGGLRPDSFLMSRTRRGQTEVAEARFDWNARSLAYGLARQPRSAPLPPDAQDFMSFIYQFVLLPPVAGRHRVPITTGSRFEVYDIEVGTEETIDTPIGALRALPVRQLPRPGAESVQIWLASEYRYLPVKIRHYDREGRFSGEQVATEIRISEE